MNLKSMTVWIWTEQIRLIFDIHYNAIIPASWMQEAFLTALDEARMDYTSMHFSKPIPAREITAVFFEVRP